jgi:L-threonine-O-3-phosphate decarboxylase
MQNLSEADFMKPILELARPEVRSLSEYIHGGEVWDIASNYDIQHGRVLDFSSNINPLGPPLKALEAINACLWRIPFYPDSNSRALRKAIAHHIGDIGEENVIVGNGSSELIHLFAEVFLGKGTEALIPIPTFSEYERAVKKTGGKTKFFRLDKDFMFHPKNLLNKINSRTRVVFLCNPNNPTSALIPRDVVLEIIQGSLAKDVIVFLDETFMEFVSREKRSSLAKQVETYPNVFVLGSFTKVFGLTGLRIGYGVACKDIVDVLFKVKLPWNVNVLAQAAAIAALEDREYLQNTERLIKEERAFLLSELKEISCFRVFPADANFIFIDIRRTGLTAAELKRKMLNHGILIRDCSSFRGLDEYFIRVAIRTRQENQRLLEALRKLELVR